MDLRIVEPHNAESNGLSLMIGGPRRMCGALRRGPFSVQNDQASNKVLTRDS